MSDKPKFYRCGDDFPDCEFARKGTEIRIEPGEVFACPYKRPQCAEQATEVKKTLLGDWWKIAAAVVGGLLLLAMFWPSSAKKPQVSSAKPLPLPPKPIPLPPTPTPAPVVVVAPTPAPVAEVPARVILRLQGPEAVSADLLSGLVEAFLRKEGFSGVETKAGTVARSRVVRGQRAGASEPESIEIKSAREQDAFGRLAKGETDFAVALRVPTAEEEGRMGGVVDVNSKA